MSQARAEIQALDEDPQEIDLAPMLEQIVASLHAMAAEQKVELCFEPSPLTVRTQPARLRSVLQNLVANAIHHNRIGGRVDVSVQQACEDASIVIADTGTGIAAEHLPHVFEPFEWRG